MAGSKSHTYRIDLDLNSSSLQKELKSAGKDLDSLQESFKRFSDYGVDASKAYRGVLKDLVKEQDKELKFYDEEAAKIINNTKLTKKQKDEQLKILEKGKKLSEAKKKELLLQDKYNKLTGKILNTQTRSGKLIAQGLKAQEKLNALLGKESKLRQGMAKMAKAGGAIVGGAMVGAGAIIGGAIGSADATVSKADALRSLAPGVKPALVGELYTKTGADYSTIVSAINNIAAIVGPSSDKLSKLAFTEIKNPGTGSLMAAQNKVDEATDYEQIFNAIRKQTGAQDTASLIQASMESKAVSKGQVSQQDYMLALAKLTGSGVKEDDAKRIISEIAKGGTKEDFIERFNNADLSKYVRGQMKNVLKNTDLKLTVIEDTDTEESPEAKAARRTQEIIRKFQMKKEELFARILPKILPMIEPILDLVDTLLPPLINVTKKIMPYMAKALGYIVKGVGWIIDAMPGSGELGQEIMAAGAIMLKASENMRIAAETKDNMKAADDLFHKMLPQRAQGGLVTSPSLCGEAGPELVLPLNNPGRCNSIINNYNNTNNFSMNAPQSPLSLSQAISNNRFIKHASTF